MPIRFGVLLTQERPVDELLRWPTRFDEAGVDSLWITDHLALPQDVDHPWDAGWDLLDLGVGTGGAPIDRACGGIADNSPGALADRLERAQRETTAFLNDDRVPVPDFVVTDLPKVRVQFD